MDWVMDYKVIEANLRKQLEINVMQALKEGYVLVGGVSVASLNNGSLYFTQAVYREE